jgi:hypothetical protein
MSVIRVPASEFQRELMEKIRLIDTITLAEKGLTLVIATKVLPRLFL